jgi:hypothetical protein
MCGCEGNNLPARRYANFFTGNTLILPFLSESGIVQPHLQNQVPGLAS